MYRYLHQRRTSRLRLAAKVRDGRRVYRAAAFTMQTGSQRDWKRVAADMTSFTAGKQTKYKQVA